MRQSERKFSVILSGVALCLAVVATHAASDQGLEAQFEKEKMAYIKQYAMPKPLEPSTSELVFTDRPQVSRAATSPSTLNKNPRPNVPLSIEAPPPPQESSHE